MPAAPTSTLYPSLDARGASRTDVRDESGAVIPPPGIVVTHVQEFAFYGAPYVLPKYYKDLCQSGLLLDKDPLALSGDPVTVPSVTRIAAGIIGSISVRQEEYGVVGDGVADDSDGVFAAMADAIAIGAEVWFPPGVYRVTRGYTQNLPMHDVYLRGPGKSVESYGGRAAVILLDSPSAASFFLNIAQSCTVKVSSLIFKTSQFVLDRDFFRFSLGTGWFSFSHCSFENVDRPIVFKNGFVFQSSSVADVTFLNSGTIHSDISSVGSGFICSQLLLLNVHHEGSTPANSAKILMDLQNVRFVESINMILEGSLPSAGWTLLRLWNPFDGNATRMPFARFRSPYFEFVAPNPPQYLIDQRSGMATMESLFGFGNTTAHSLIRLSDHALFLLKETSCTEIISDIADCFEQDNDDVIVRLIDCNLRCFDLTNRKVHHERSTRIIAGLSYRSSVESNGGASEAWRWRGGYLSAEGVTLQQFGGSTYTPSSDATYGRKLVFIPSAGVLDTHITVPNRGAIAAGDQIVICGRAKLPTFASGSWGFGIKANDGDSEPVQYFDASYSGAVVDFIVCRKVKSAVASIGVHFYHGTTSGATGVLEVYALAFYVGETVPRSELPVYPAAVITHGSSAPVAVSALGAWAVGDIVKNSAPAVGQPKGWVCTVAGTPGTWVSEGNL